VLRTEGGAGGSVGKMVDLSVWWTRVPTETKEKREKSGGGCKKEERKNLAVGTRAHFGGHGVRMFWGTCIETGGLTFCAKNSNKEGKKRRERGENQDGRRLAVTRRTSNALFCRNECRGRRKKRKKGPVRGGRWKENPQNNSVLGMKTCEK